MMLRGEVARGGAFSSLALHLVPGAENGTQQRIYHGAVLFEDPVFPVNQPTDMK